MIADNLTLDKKFFGEKTAIISKSGFGKSYTARVVIEEGLELGNTFIIIDPQRAYENIPEFENVHISDIKDIRGFARLLAATNKNVVISTNKTTIEEQNLFLKKFLKEFRKNKRRGIQTIIIDEIHKFAPNQAKTEAKDEVRAMFQEDRSSGQGAIGLTQRPARMDTTIISQADNLALGRVTSNADKQAIFNYLDNKEDIETVKKLEKGEFFLVGFDFDEPQVVKIRESKTEHSGNSPDNLLNENPSLFHNQSRKVLKKRKMADKIDTKGEPVDKIIPSQEGFMDLIGLGAKIAFGGAVGGIASGLLARPLARLNIPLVSPRTIASTGTTIGLYALWRNLPDRMERSKDVAKFAAAGSAVFWMGSIVGDVLAGTGLKLPGILQSAITVATGVGLSQPTEVQDEAGTQPVDLDTNFA